MSNTNTGGPAFPSTEPSQEHTPFFDHHDGMTLRDYFAAKAMQGLIGCADWREGLDEDEASDFTAFAAYEMADAMLKARNQ